MRRRLVLIGLGIATIGVIVSHGWWQPQLKAWLTQLLDSFGGGDNLQGLDSLINIITAIGLVGMAVWVWSGGKPQESPSIQSHEAIDPTRNARSRNESILLKAVADEVESRLAQSLHQAGFINLDKQVQPEQVQCPWDADIKIGAKPSEPLPSGTKILDVFKGADIKGKLLILGEPGSGKTTTLLDLAQVLTQKAAEDSIYPLPVLFNLSSWKDPRQGMKDWLVAELKSKYGVRKEIGDQWIKDQQLLPLLDGLDEVKPEHQESCVKAINQLLESDCRPRDLVVCSRREEYENYQTQLQLNDAVLLHDLTNAQIQDYLRIANCAELWQELAADEALLELVRKPLLLSITVLSYAEIPLEQWGRTTSTKARLKLLVDAYVQRMLLREFESWAYRNQKPPTARQTRQWLGFLAQQLQKESQTEFLIEKMQPSLLRKHQKWTYRLILGLISGLISGLIVGLIGRLIFGLIFGLIGGLIGGSIVGLDNIDLIESFQFSCSQETGKKVLKSLGYWLIVGLFLGLFLGLISGLIGGLFFGSISGLFFWLIVGLIFGLIGGLKADIETRIRPNQGIINSSKNTIVLTILSLIIAVIAQGFLLKFLSHFLSESQATRMTASTTSLLVLYSFQEGGGLACIQHFSLRLILYSNKLIPWDYARFLNHATDRMFLQRVGGRYRFIHKLLQEHFAEMGEVGSRE